MPRIVILTEGKSNPRDAKTATGVLRYRTDDVVAVLDTECAGRTAGELLDVGGDIPIVASLEGVDANQLVIGIAPAGGQLPEEWRDVLRDAMRRGMDIVSGLHFFLSDDPEFVALAAERGVRLVDVRRPPDDLEVSTCEARNAPCFRVHTVGHDCGVGKLVTSLEIDSALRRRGHDTAFVATGQTGILVAGSGVPVDAVVADFISGAIERLVLERSDSEFVLVEGQGSLIHPLYSGVTLGLLHGCAPQAMVMVVDPTREAVRHSELPMPPLPEIIDLYERMAGVMCPSRVVAVAVNTSMLDEAAARSAVDEIAAQTRLPASDVFRFGIDPIADAVVAEREAKGCTE